MYSFMIKKDETVLAKVAVDEKTDNIGFIGKTDNSLNKILNMLVDMPYLIVTTGDKIHSSYVQMHEKISVKDKRFYQVLKSQLVQYDFTEPKTYDEQYTLQDIFNGALNMHRKIVIMGKKMQSTINFCKKEGYLEFPDDILGDLSNVEDQNSILLVCDDRENPYASINKIISGYDKFIKLRNNDTVVFAEARYDSNEKALVKVENDLAMHGCKIVSLPKDKNILLHASSEDLMLMIKLLNPKFYIPVKGEYRFMVGNANLASDLGIPNENILLKQNGDVITIENQELVDNFETIKVNDILIDGKSSDDIGELVVKDREMLSENGIVLISATLSKENKVLLVGPEVTTRGFIYVKDSKDMILEIKRISENIIERNIADNFVDYNKIKTEIRSELSKYLYDETGCKPMIIAVVQEV